MNKLITFTIVLSVAVFLTGCYSDKKQATTIQQIMEESAEFENDFAANQTDLNKMRKNEQLVYDDLISLNINDKDILIKKLDEAHTFTKKQEKLLEEAKENFQKAYKKSATIEKHIKMIKEEEQKNQASKLITIMNERKKWIDTFFENYHENLELQNTFYQHLEDENLNFEDLNGLINDINKRSQDMGEIIKQFNQYTKQYIEVENDFYQMN